MYVWLCWVFVSVRGLSLVVASGGHSSSRCVGLSLLRPLVAAHRLQTRRLSNCGSRAELLRGMWDLPRPGLKPAFSALAGRFSTTAPPGKPYPHFIEEETEVLKSEELVEVHILSKWQNWDFKPRPVSLMIAPALSSISCSLKSFRIIARSLDKLFSAFILVNMIHIYSVVPEEPFMFKSGSWHALLRV